MPANDLTRLKTILGELEAFLKENRPDYYRTLKKGTTSSKINATLKKHNLPEVPELNLLLNWHNGQNDFDSLVDNHMLMSVGAIMEAIEIVNEDGFRLIPFMDNGGGSYICVTADTHHIVQYYADEDDIAELAENMHKFMEKVYKAYARAIKDGDDLENVFI